jgi:beta-lactamase regulating signal transducer with metallopeptidase domain
VRAYCATSCSFCNFPHVVEEVWEIVLLVWIVVIPATVAMLTALAARRRAARLRGSVYGATDQPGQLLRLAVHARRLENVHAPGAAHGGALGLGQRQQFGDPAG